MKFGKVIQASASENPEWASYYIDYKALKQILSQLTPPGEEQTEGGAQLEGLFLSSLLLQLQKVNAFYVVKAQELAQHLERIMPLINQGVVFGALVSDQQPMSTVPRLVLHKLVQSPRVPQDTRQAIALFIQLGEELDRLRKYALLNFLAVVKVVKKHDKLSSLPLRQSISTFVSTQRFHTSDPILVTYTKIRNFSLALTAIAYGSKPPNVTPPACTRCNQPHLMIGLLYDGSMRMCPACVSAAAEHAATDQQLSGWTLTIDPLFDAPSDHFNGVLDSAASALPSLWNPPTSAACGGAGAGAPATPDPSTEGNDAYLSGAMLRDGLARLDSLEGFANFNGNTFEALAQQLEERLANQGNGNCSTNNGCSNSSCNALSLGGSAPMQTSSTSLSMPSSQPMQHASSSVGGGQPHGNSNSLGVPGGPMAFQIRPQNAPPNPSPLGQSFSSMGGGGAASQPGGGVASCAQPNTVHAVAMPMPMPGGPNQQQGGGMLQPNGMPPNGMPPQGNPFQNAAMAGAAMAGGFGGGGMQNLGGMNALACAGAFGMGGMGPMMGQSLSPLGGGGGGEKAKKWACTECHKAKTACEGNPCRRCQRLGKTCIMQERPIRKARGRHAMGGGSGEKLIDTSDPNHGDGSADMHVVGSVMPLAGDLLGKTPATTAMMLGQSPPQLGAPGMTMNPALAMFLGQPQQQPPVPTNSS